MLCGAFLGISVIAPGVSGSVMAVIMGIYDQLIAIISNPFRDWKRNFFYLLPMGIGALICMVALIRVLEYCFARFPFPSAMLFVGLISGSLPTVYEEASKGGIRPRDWLASLAAFCVAATVGLLAKTSPLAPQEGSLVHLAVCGFVAGLCSMVPGMSVSMVLMMLGAYQTLLSAASRFDLPVIFVVGLCFGTGMVLFSRLTKRVFETHRSLGYAMVLGFMCGSLLAILPRLPESTPDFVVGIVTALCGIAAATLFRRLGQKLNVG